MPSTLDVAEALADALTDVSPIGTVTVSPIMLFTSGADAIIDIYPADPSEEELAMGLGTVTMWWTVRLRVPTNDSEGNQEFLYTARDQTGPWSVRAALEDDTTLGGVSDGLFVGRPSGFQLYEDAPGSGSIAYIGQEWRVGVYVS